MSLCIGKNTQRIDAIEIEAIEKLWGIQCMIIIDNDEKCKEIMGHNGMGDRRGRWAIMNKAQRTEREGKVCMIVPIKWNGRHFEGMEL